MVQVDKKPRYIIGIFAWPGALLTRQTNFEK
jgi:hypothetical protein